VLPNRDVADGQVWAFPPDWHALSVIMQAQGFWVVRLVGMPNLIETNPDYLEFWRERHLTTLTTLRSDGRPHVVPVGVTVDAAAGVARIITRKSSRKIANVLAAQSEGARVAVCQVDGPRWATLEGTAEVITDAGVVSDAVARYAERYGRMPGPDPERVVIQIKIDRTMGFVGPLGPPGAARAS